MLVAFAFSPAAVESLAPIVLDRFQARPFCDQQRIQALSSMKSNGRGGSFVRLWSHTVDDNSSSISSSSSIDLNESSQEAHGRRSRQVVDNDDWFVTGTNDDDDKEDENDVVDEDDQEAYNDRKDLMEETELESDIQPGSLQQTKNPHTLQRYNILLASIEKALENNRRKKEALQKELDKAKSLEDTMKRANLIISNLYQLPPGTQSAIVQDWDVQEEGGMDVELVLSDKYATAQEEADALFAAARKMKRGSAVVGELIVETEECLRVLKEAKMDLVHVFGQGDENVDVDVDMDVDVEDYLSMILNRLERSRKQTGFYLLPPSIDGTSQRKNNHRNNHNHKNTSNTRTQHHQQTHNCRKFRSPGGCIVLVGRNRRDNEAICFQIAKGDDIWMHARGCPGAHVLLQVRRGSPKPTPQDLQFAANLAAFYSEFRTERKADVTLASPKHILKPRGAPLGAVKIRQEMNSWIGFPEDVDEEIKVARESSGVVSSWDESTGLRSLGGKAKNKKRTRENVKQRIAKKRAEKRAKKKRRNEVEVDSSNDVW